MRTSARRRDRQPRYRKLAGLERLETRDVLAANPAASFDLAIRGTDMSYSDLGLPAEMSGDVFRASQGAASGGPIGRYEEQLTPILMDIDGDQNPDFVGTHGVATFTFFVGTVHHVLGLVTTANTSYIQGFTPAGQLVVGSQGIITAASGWMRNMTGGFVSQSTVAMGPSFSMQTLVHFEVNRPVDHVLVALACVAEHVGQHTSANSSSRNEPAAADDGRGPRYDDEAVGQPMRSPHWGDYDGQPDLSGDGDDARDSLFADDLDWRPGRSNKAFGAL